MGVVEKPVADGVSEGGIAELIVPELWVELAGDDGRAIAVAVIDNFEEVSAFALGERGEPPVIKDEDVDLGQSGEETGIGAVRVSEGEFLEEARHAAVEGAVALSAGLLRQGTGDVRLAGSGGTGDEDVLVLGDPAAARKLADDTFVELSLGRVVDVLDAGGTHSELCVAQAARDARILPGQVFRVDQHAQAFVEGERRRFGVFLLLCPGPSEGGQSEVKQLLHRGFIQH